LSTVLKPPKLATGFVNLLKTPYFHIYVERENTGGNFCGHDPKSPKQKYRLTQQGQLVLPLI
jgi:hypothetical protein